MDFQSFIMELTSCIFFHFHQKKRYLNQPIFQKNFSRLRYKNNIIEYLDNNFPNIKYKISFKEEGYSLCLIKMSNNSLIIFQLGFLETG